MERGAAFAVFEFDDVDALNQLGQKWGEYYFWPLVERRCLRSLAWLLNLNPGLALHTNAMSDRDNVLHNIARTRSKLSIGVLDSCKKMERMFVQAGTPINARNFCGSTPIHALWSNVQKADPWILAMTRIFIDCGSRPISHNSE